LPDGNIEFIGRIDNQVKIRGFRIELGEIEVVLGQHPAVREAIVAVREDNPGTKRLVGYVVARSPGEPAGSELRDYLKDKLPGYMIPSAFVRLDKLPLTANGKVDRSTLPAPEVSRSEFEDGFVPPRTPTEELLANMWAEVLGVKKVGVHDSFFELGGHSLLATKIVSRVRDVLSAELSLREFFEAPTVSAIAQGLNDNRRHQQIGEGQQITRVARGQFRLERA